MLRALHSDKNNIIDILATSFQKNPTLNVITRDRNKQNTIRGVIDYAFDYAKRRDGVFISDNKSCVALCFQSQSYQNKLFDMIDKLKLLYKSIRISKLFTILSHLRYVKKVRPQDEAYYYIWFLGASPKSNPKSTRAFIQKLFAIAQSDNLPIYAETTILKNRRVFERFGFETYHEFYNNSLDITVYFMRKVATQ